MQEKGRLHLDHDHATGAFRGWLCMCCNTAIGKLGDTVEGLNRAVAYIERNT
jgi:Recombination endonuclease VII